MKLYYVCVYSNIEYEYAYNLFHSLKNRLFFCIAFKLLKLVVITKINLTQRVINSNHLIIYELWNIKHN